MSAHPKNRNLTERELLATPSHSWGLAANRKPFVRSWMSFVMTLAFFLLLFACKITGSAPKADWPFTAARIVASRVSIVWVHQATRLYPENWIVYGAEYQLEYFVNQHPYHFWVDSGLRARTREAVKEQLEKTTIEYRVYYNPSDPTLAQAVKLDSAAQKTGEIRD